VTLFRKLLFNERLVGVMGVLMLVTCSYGQQETDPSWYDPWAKTTVATARVQYVNKRRMDSQTKISQTSTIPRKPSGKVFRTVAKNPGCQELCKETVKFRGGVGNAVRRNGSCNWRAIISLRHAQDDGFEPLRSTEFPVSMRDTDPEN